MEKDKIIELFDKIILISVAIICGIIIFCGLIGETKIFGWAISYPYISCILLCAIAIHLILSIFGSFGQKQIESKIDFSIKTIINSVLGVEKQTFQSMNEIDDYVAKRIVQASQKVYDLNWLVSDKPSNKDVEKDRIEKFHKSLNAGLKNFNKRKNTLFYREIFVFHYPLKVKVMKARLIFDKYSCKFYHKDNKFPKIQFVIIDDKEVIFISSLYKDGLLCSIKDEIMVRLFIQYFDYSWKNAIPIKEDGKINSEIIKEIEQNV